MRNSISLLLALVFGLIQSNTALAQAPRSVNEQHWGQVKSLRGIATQQRTTTPSLYVFFDPNCPYCAKLWQSRVADRPVADVHAYWIPISYMDRSSYGKAAALLRLNQKTGLTENFGRFDYERRSGAIPAVQPTKAEATDLAKALAVWQKLGAGTPLMVWRSRSGRVVSYLGFPSEARLAELFDDISRTLQEYPDNSATKPQPER